MNDYYLIKFMLGLKREEERQREVRHKKKIPSETKF